MALRIQVYFDIACGKIGSGRPVQEGCGLKNLSSSAGEGEAAAIQACMETLHIHSVSVSSLVRPYNYYECTEHDNHWSMEPFGRFSWSKTCLLDLDSWCACFVRRFTANKCR
jgi:hypothetical protein